MKARALAIALSLVVLGGVSTGCGGSRRSSEKDRNRLVARATASDTAGTAPLTVRFRDASHGAPATWRWTFGDGAESRDVAPSHVFAQPGSYTVWLEVTDVLGQRNVAAVASVTVSAPPPAAASTSPGAGTTAAASTARPQTTGSPYWCEGDVLGNPLKQPTAEEAALAQAILVGVNAERANAGLPPLAPDDQAARASKAHAEDMHGRGYFDHLSPEGWTPEDRLRMTGASGYRATAENIYAGPPVAATVVAAWVASPGHRANILAPTLTHLGVGARAAGNGSLVVAVFTTR